MSKVLAFNRHKLYRLTEDQIRRGYHEQLDDGYTQHESRWKAFWNGLRRLQALFGIAFCLFVVGLVVGWVS
jgi:acetylglutamate synthase